MSRTFKIPPKIQLSDLLPVTVNMNAMEQEIQLILAKNEVVKII